MLCPCTGSAGTAEIRLPTQNGELRIALLRGDGHDRRQFAGGQTGHALSPEIFGQPTLELPRSTRLARHGTSLFTAAIAVERQRQKPRRQIGEPWDHALSSRLCHIADCLGNSLWTSRQ